ncbi:MAG TPA: YHS domain-containing protein [Bryobacteraceae bacterium]|jgi:YHS domain-containing protein
MTRAILYLIAFVLIIGVARSVLGIIAKGFSDLFGTAASGQPGPGPRSAPLPKAEALKKDPVCGTFIAPSTAVQKTVGGQLYYFCSPECRDKFRG